MSFVSVAFWLLLIIYVFVYYLLPAKYRVSALLLFNLFFYGMFSVKMLAILLIVTGLVYICTLLMVRSKRRRLYLYLNIFGMVLFLLSARLLAIIPISQESIVIPVGISFWMLQCISYVVDVYKGKIGCEYSFISFLTYNTSFWSVTSGPITRYDRFLQQKNIVQNGRKLSFERLSSNTIDIIYGLFLKLVISERLSILVNGIYSDYKEQTSIVLVVAALAYSIQLYTDFAGYSYIVIGIAGLLGYDLPDNFNAPYFSKSINEFWDRWHISFSTWLQDYVYISLGGNRKGKRRKAINLLITFIVSAAWHGFKIHYLVWGILHGILTAASSSFKSAKMKIYSMLGIKSDAVFETALSRLLIYAYVTFAWIFFREGFMDALGIIYRIVFRFNFQVLNSDIFLDFGLSRLEWILLLAAVFVMIKMDKLIYNRGCRLGKCLQDQGAFFRVIVSSVLAISVLIFGLYGDVNDAASFVYTTF